MPPQLLVFFGAGASKPLGIPTNRELYDEFVRTTEFNNLATRSDFPANFDTAIRSCGIEPFDVEAVMSVLSAIASEHPPATEAILRGGKPAALFLARTMSKDFFSPRLRPRAEELLLALKQYIRNRCENFDPGQLRITYDPVFYSFIGEKGTQIQWATGTDRFRDNLILGASRGYPGEYLPFASYFTTNYDCALERYFDIRGLTPERGFSHGPKVFLDPSMIHQEHNHKLLKLHGSVDMVRLEDGTVIQSAFQPARKTLTVQSVAEDVLIFPTQEKELFRFPFVDFFWEFVRALRSARLWVFVGFSFSDVPILRLVSTEATVEKKIVVVSPRASEICSDSQTLGQVQGIAQLCPVDASLGHGDISSKITACNQE